MNLHFIFNFINFFKSKIIFTENAGKFFNCKTPIHPINWESIYFTDSAKIKTVNAING